MTQKQHQSVSQFVNQLKGVVSSHPAFKSVSIVGEISNFKAHHSGHFYFSLKDNKSRIACVMFKTSAVGVGFKPKDGDRVVISGRVDVFEASGSVQIYVTTMIMDGVGALYIEYEKLRKDFEAKGYFNAEYKKRLPQYPQRIGVITGEGSAAYRDISITLATRWPIATQVDLLAFVQGDNAINSIVTNLMHADTLNLDVVILGRGGGSIEDLWAFNAPEVVEAIFNMKTPVVTGIGHESDTTLSDFVADVRGATPTAATVAATPDQYEISRSLRDYKNLFYTRVRNTLLKQQHHYKNIVLQSKLNDPLQDVYRKQQRLDYYQNQMMQYHQTLGIHLKLVQQYPAQFANILMRRIALETTQIHRINDRMIMNQNHSVSTQVQTLNYQQETLHQNMLRFQNKIQPLLVQNQTYTSRIITLTQRSLNLKASALTDIIKAIDKLEPTRRLQAIFNQGFGRISHNNIPITSIKSIQEKDYIRIELSDGYVHTQAIGKEEKNDKDL